MKFSIILNINRPPEDVWAAITDNEKVMKWMPELVAYEHISGTRGKEGSSTRLSYEVGKTKFDAIQKIKASDFPRLRTSYYAMKGYLAVSTEQLEKKSDGMTRLESTVEYNFESPFMKLFSSLLKPVYKAVYLKKLKPMKLFAELEAAHKW